MMKTLSPSELKNLALTHGSEQYLAFDELARRIREDPSSWNPEKGPWPWDYLEITPAPNAIAAERAILGWAHQLNDEKNPELEQEQEARIEKLERLLEQDPESHEISRKLHDAIGEKVRSATGTKGNTR